MSSNIAIKVENVSKCYQIYDAPSDRIKQFVFPHLRRLTGSKSKQYFREFWALKNISFELKRGVSLGVLGLNGAGKSTLLQLICKTLAPTSGNITVNGRIAALLELGAGFNPEFSGLENIRLNGAILGLSNRQIEGKLDEILSFADIGDFVHQPVKTYSSGMYVRLAFAIAINSDPDILVIDEALSVGDFLFQQKCNLFIKDNLSGVTKLFVSHDIGAVANLTDMALVLKRGELIYFGDSQRAIQEYQRASRASGRGGVGARHRDELKSEGPGVADGGEEGAGGAWIDIPLTSLSGSLRLKVEKFVCFVEGRGGATVVRPGDRLKILFRVKGEEEVVAPIVGYQVQDRYGLVVFGENSLTSNFAVKSIPAGENNISMELNWPEIPSGKYSVTVGVGAGLDGEAHEVVCWAHNIFICDSLASRPVHGMFNNKILGLRIDRNESRNGQSL